MNTARGIEVSAEAGGFSAAEGRMPVPGAVLHYRVSGPEAATDVVVFENGWGALFLSAAWLERALAPHVRFICYDRAGIGESTSTEPLTTARITEQFAALLSGLGISRPVVVIGHSYGGLIAALHAAQAPEQVRAIIQVDPTPEYPYKEDAGVDQAPTSSKLTKWAIRLGFTGVVSSIYDGLPDDALRRITKSRKWMIHVINGSIPEIKLFRGIQRVVQDSAAAKSIPRLVISARESIAKGLLKLVLGQEKIEAILKVTQDIHRRQAQHNKAGRWISFQHNHYTILFHREGAELVARSALDFLRAT